MGTQQLEQQAFDRRDPNGEAEGDHEFEAALDKDAAQNRASDA
ncbi:hypothetical protein AKJ09_02948 [Labilithrix luteola]|uniref:Uncharacterized protein n=1 Tax=Labilithrix luteola TaxID=1391654 RepID=A0A0K1PT40_9BACT|nr:hypothetical protein [Labilithrix luteola]AKU96284.1 hypothetical protein AKJ09_02948 [Labilithrix luteola]